VTRQPTLDGVEERTLFWRSDRHFPVTATFAPTRLQGERASLIRLPDPYLETFLTPQAKQSLQLDGIPEVLVRDLVKDSVW
jgi:hypothetical protein